MLEIKDSNFSRTVLQQGDLVKKFKENNLAKVNFLNLLTKEKSPKTTSNFHRPKYVGFSTIEITSEKYVEITWIFRQSKLRRKKYVKMTWIFRSAKLHRKSTSK